MNRIAIALPSAAVALGSLFLYLGLKSGANGYVTLSIDGAFLLLLGLVSILAPRIEVTDVGTLASLSKPVEGVGEHVPEILREECFVRFTGDAKIALVWADQSRRLVIDPLGPKLRAKVAKQLGAKQGRTGQLTLKFAKQLAELGALSDLKLEEAGSSATIRLVRPIVGVPLLPEHHEPGRVGAIIVSSRLLAILVGLASADIGYETVVKSLAKESEDLVIHLEKVTE